MNIKKLNFFFAFLAFVLIISMASPFSYAAAKEKGAKVIMLVVDRTTLEHMASAHLTSWERMVKQGAIGLMVTNGAKDITSESSYATIGGGSRAFTVPEIALAFNYDEKIDDIPAHALFHTYNRFSAPKGSVVNIGFSKMLNGNAENTYTYIPGNLGKVLKINGITTVALGNADYIMPFKGERQYLRQISAIAMDEKGIVKKGNVGDAMIKKNRNFPGLLSTNYPNLLKEIEKYLSYAQPAFIAVELGDTKRIDENQAGLTKAGVYVYRNMALRGVDSFLGELLRVVDLKNDTLIVITPSTTSGAYLAWNRMTPVLILGQDIKPGLLTSASTRAAGIITNVDIAPTVLARFAVKGAQEMVGSPVVTANKQVPDQIGFLLEMNKKNVSNLVQRMPVLRPFFTLEIIVLIVVAGCILLASRMNKRVFSVLQLLLLWLIATPLTLLLVAIHNPMQIWITVLEIIVFSCMIIFLSRKAGKHLLDPFIFICGLTTFLLMFDLLTGAKLISNSLLGYSPIVGARFYGIGNEYMGVFLGAVLLTTTAILQRWQNLRKSLVYINILIYIAVLVLMAYPRFGAEVGGTLSGVIVFYLVYIKLSNKKITKKFIGIALLCSMLAVGALIGLDFIKGTGPTSHVGRAIELIRTGGIQQAFLIIERKMAMNIKLIRFSIWSRILLTSLAVLGVLTVKPVGVLKKLGERFPDLAVGFNAIIWASILNLILNDSGIVAAATTIIYLVVPVLYLVVELDSKKRIA